MKNSYLKYGDQDGNEFFLRDEDVIVNFTFILSYSHFLKFIYGMS